METMFARTTEAGITEASAVGITFDYNTSLLALPKSNEKALWTVLNITEST